MTISNVIQRGSLICLYDVKGRIIRTLNTKDGLHAFTPNNVIVRGGKLYFTYDLQGRIIPTMPA